MDIKYCPNCGSKRIYKETDCPICFSETYKCKKCNLRISFEIFDELKIEE